MSKVTILKAEVEERGGTFKDDSGNDRAYTTRVPRIRGDDPRDADADGVADERSPHTRG